LSDRIRIAIHSFPLHSSSPSSPSLVPNKNKCSPAHGLRKFNTCDRTSRLSSFCLAPLHVLHRLVSRAMQDATSPASSLQGCRAATPLPPINPYPTRVTRSTYIPDLMAPMRAARPRIGPHLPHRGLLVCFTVLPSHSNIPLRDDFNSGAQIDSLDGVPCRVLPPLAQSPLTPDNQEKTVHDNVSAMRSKRTLAHGAGRVRAFQPSGSHAFQF
jgi:hypothetical protein